MKEMSEKNVLSPQSQSQMHNQLQKASPSDICHPHPDGFTSCWDTKDLKMQCEKKSMQKVKKQGEKRE